MSQKSAPVALFVYTRLWHTRQTVESLRKNYLADESELFIYSDGPKSQKDRYAVIELRGYLNTIKGFRRVHVIEREKNYGLAASITDGVSNIVNSFGSVIVLEDDIVTAPYFLQYMNDGLRFYRNNNAVISISGFVDPRIVQKNPFFLRGADCWGWATWKRGWKVFEKDGSKLLQALIMKRLVHKFDYYGGQHNSQMLQDQVDGKTESWAIRWHASAFLAGKLTLYPGMSLVRNIGHDGSGTNSYKNLTLQRQQLYMGSIHLKRISVRASIEVARAIARLPELNKHMYSKNLAVLLLTHLRRNYFYSSSSDSFTRSIQAGRSFGLRMLRFYKNVRFTVKFGIRYMPIVNYQHIGGWLSEEQAILLYELSNGISARDPVIVELGSWLGKSSFLLVKGVQRKGARSRVYCVDPFNADGDDNSKCVYDEDYAVVKREKLTLKQKFIQNMKQLHVYNSIRVCKGYSYNFADRVKEKIDLLFIDADHSYNAVLRDFTDWSPKIKSGGLLVFHDVDFNPREEPSGTAVVGPGLVIRRHIIHSVQWYDFHYTSGMFYCRKR